MKTLTNHTFVICAYKESQYLEDCIKSLLSQTVKSEMIVVTSTPNDYIKDTANKYGIKMYSHNDGSIGKDWNFGMSIPKTQYITIAHQDDIYCKTYLETCMKMFEEHPDTLVAFTDYDELKDGKITPKNTNLKIKKLMLSPLKFFKRSIFVRRRVLSLGCPICCPAVSYNMKTIGDFKFNDELTVSLDWEAWHRISMKRGRFEYCDKALMYHRIHDGSETTNAIEENRRMREDEMMLEKFWPKFIAKPLLKLYSKSQNANNK